MGKYTDHLQEVMAEQLRAEKAVAQKTFQEIADATGLHQQTVIRYFKGTRDIPMTALSRLAELFGLTPTELMSRAVDRIK